MILTLICLTAMQAMTAADYFPTTPGLVRTYEHDKAGDLLINKIGEPLDMGGATVTPITESTGASSGKTTYYRVEPDQVSIVAYDLKHPMLTPMPVLKLGNGEVSWNYEGSTASKFGERLRAFGKARSAGKRNVLGKKVDVIVVKLSAVVGEGLSGLMFDQTTVYAKGIGMVEQTTVQTLGKKTIKDKYTLKDIEPGK
jgi:hypothetical protein